MSDVTQWKLAFRVTQSAGSIFTDSEHKRTMKASERLHKVLYGYFTHNGGSDNMTLYDKDFITEGHVIL